MAGDAGYGRARQEAFGGCSDVEIAWAAGLFEGEGCLTWSGGSVREHPAASLNMVDRDVVERFALLVGLGNFRPERQQVKRGWKPQWVWGASGVEAVDAARVLLPFFGERRRAKAQEMIDWYVDTYLKECAECGNPFIALKRNQAYCCRECSRIRDQQRENERRRETTASKPRVKACEDCGAVFTLAWNGGQNNTKRCSACRVIAIRKWSRESKAKRHQRAVMS